MLLNSRVFCISFVFQDSEHRRGAFICISLYSAALSLIAGGGRLEFAFPMKSIPESKICPMTSGSSRLCSLDQGITVGYTPAGSFLIKKVTKGAGVTVKMEPIKYSKKVDAF